ncbi:hypothetical protein H8689_05970 [Lachnospiraceae bacterium NSJ-29]|uniref:Uncharacterized protein n=2 Tax=Wansuia hejianensis TaxID=2763667 RepID=A0A926EYF9_9FIRM|nr:hypothetical protein [Wansuia hejianensis]
MLEVYEMFDRDCIIVDKVFASCQQRECFPEIEVDLDGKEFGDIKFKPGIIIPNTLVITDIEGQPDFRRVRFRVRIPFVILNPEGKVIVEDHLPDIYKDIVLYIPDARDEFSFKIVVETSSSTLAQPICTGKVLNFPVGTFIIVKVVGTVQLLIPAYGYCPEPPECTEFSPADICETFDYGPFPDFFPPQLPQAGNIND